jgi:hypothetical protein
VKKPFLRTVIAAVTLAVGALAMAQPAAASTPVYIAGNSCTPVAANALVRSQFGPYQNATGGIDVVCPLTTDGEPWKTEIVLQVNGYNRNSADPLSCSLTVTDEFGNLSDTLRAVAASAGAPMVFPVDYRLGATSLVHPNLSLTCHLPGRTTLGFSHLTTVIVFKG